MQEGWVSLHRKALESKVYSDERAWRLFTTLLLKANWSPGYFKGEHVNRGQLATSMRSLAELLEWSAATVHRTLDKLVEFGCVEVEVKHRFSLITISNYETYQDANSERETQMKRKRNADETDIIKEQEEQSLSCSGQAPNDKRPKFVFEPEDMRYANRMWELIANLQPNRKKPNLESWANTVRLMREQDNRTYEEIGQVFKAANSDPFWQTNILSADALRKQFDNLSLKLLGSSSNDQERVEDVYKPLELPR